MIRPYLIIPSEIQVREFDSKLLLACFAAERGYRAIVGSRVAIHNSIAALPKGIYVAKDAARTSAKIFKILEGLGTPIVAWDEEAIVYYSIDLFVRHRVNPAALSRADRYLTWGRQQYCDLKQHPAFASTTLVSTGNPRTDLLRPELRAFHDDAVQALRQRFGSMILVNSNFGRLNHFLPHRRLTPSAPGELARRNLAPTEPPLEFWRLREQILKEFRALVPSLARAFPDRTIIVRPHPAESHQFWLDVAGGHGNVQVIHEGSVVPWLMAADVMIHNGCTTGVEAFLLDRPAIAFRPFADPPNELMLPNDLSANVETCGGVIELVARALAGQWHHVPDAAALETLTSTIDGISGPMACERVLGAIDELAAAKATRPPPGHGQRIAAYRLATVRAASKRLQSVLPFHKNARRNAIHRFPGISQAEVEARVRRFGACLQRFGSVRVKTLRANVFEVFTR